MSYRTIKRLLGETSLERKCRFLFGGGLLILIVGSFAFYGHRTVNLLNEQNQMMGKLRIQPIVAFEHWKRWEWDENKRKLIELIEDDTTPILLKDHKYALRMPGADVPVELRPKDAAGHEAMGLLLQGANQITRPLESGDFQYYGAVRAEKSCILCHEHDDKSEGDLLGMVEVTFPGQQMEKKQAKNNAILLATAIVTTFLAMVAAYAIVRYVIVKPLLHLKDVSDSIARGNLDLRADIRTGDEFEELSHAFNRMLRHLVAVQEELRQVNGSLDAKVDELAQVNMRLFEMNNLKNDFLTTMSHELRTPLNSILGFSDVLAGSAQLDEKQKRYLNNIQGSGKDLLTMINDILDLAKIESGKMELHLVQFSIEDSVARLVDMVRPLAEKKNIDLSYEVDPELPLLHQDPGKLQQIIYNLLSNAIKFTPEGGRVRASVVRGEEEGQFALRMDDTGVGIPLEDQETIFEKFRQGNTTPGGDNAITREFAGTGLGLSIVKELCKLLGGEVTLKSELGKGSTFTVCAPIHLAEEIPQLDDTLAQQSLDVSNLRRIDYGLLEIAGKDVNETPDPT